LFTFFKIYIEYYDIYIFLIIRFLKDIVIQILVTMWNDTLFDGLFITVRMLVPSKELHICIF